MNDHCTDSVVGDRESGSCRRGWPTIGATDMPDVSQHIEDAREFTRLAMACKDDFVREQLLNKAREWMALALRETEKMLLRK